MTALHAQTSSLVVLLIGMAGLWRGPSAVKGGLRRAAFGSASLDCASDARALVTARK